MKRAKYTFIFSDTFITISECKSLKEFKEKFKSPGDIILRERAWVRIIKKTKLYVYIIDDICELVRRVNTFPNRCYSMKKL